MLLFLIPLLCSTLKTPQILELSGFGRKDVLEKIGIPVKVELPGVGENVQDHIFVSLSWGKQKKKLLLSLCSVKLPC